MTDHPAVAYLRNAHERAQGQVRAANGNTWDDDRSDFEGHAWVINEDMHLFETDPATAAHIAANDPTAVLARVAAERVILAGCLQALDEGKEYITGTFLVVHVIEHLAAGWGWTEES